MVYYSIIFGLPFKAPGFIFWCPWIVFEQVMLCSAVTEAIFSSSQPAHSFLFSLVVSLLATGCRLQFSLLPSRFKLLRLGNSVEIKNESTYDLFWKQMANLKFRFWWVSIEQPNNGKTNRAMHTSNLVDNSMMDNPVRS